MKRWTRRKITLKYWTIATTMNRFLFLSKKETFSKKFPLARNSFSRRGVSQTPVERIVWEKLWAKTMWCMVMGKKIKRTIWTPWMLSLRIRRRYTNRSSRRSCWRTNYMISLLIPWTFQCRNQRLIVKPKRKKKTGLSNCRATSISSGKSTSSKTDAFSISFIPITTSLT